MQKVMILANSSGGLYDFRNEVVMELLKKYEVTICLPDHVKTDLLKNEGCNIIEIPMNRRGVNPIEDIKLYHSYKKVIKQIQPDIILTYTIKPNIYGGFAARQARAPYLSTITGLGTTFQKDGLFKKIIIHMYRVGLKKAECIFFQNAQNQSIFNECRIAGKKSKLVSGSGVDLKLHKFEEYEKGDTTIFLFIARIMKEKGIDEFLKAAEELHSEKVQFQILGACDEDYESILKKYEDKRIVKLLGFQKEVHDFIKASSAVVLPTYHEGMSNVLMEASATGRPVIATDISGCREIYVDGITGFGCEARSADSLISALKRFIALNTKERAEMGKCAREKMEQEFDRTLVTDVYIDEVNNVLSIEKDF